MNIYVANINFKATEEDLKELFAKYGTVDSAKLVTDRETGRSRGFGFVDMPNDTEAIEAIKELSGSDFNGRALVVNEARPQENKGSDKRNSGNDRKKNYSDKRA